MPRRRYELTDEQYERIEHLLPEIEARSCPPKDHREAINGYFLSQSGQELLGETSLNGTAIGRTVYDRFRRWATDGTLESIVQHS
jgi:transposase